MSKGGKERVRNWMFTPNPDRVILLFSAKIIGLVVHSMKDCEESQKLHVPATGDMPIFPNPTPGIMKKATVKTVSSDYSHNFSVYRTKHTDRSS